MMWLALVIWIIVGALSFINRKNTDLHYWKVTYWLTYGTLMLLVVANCIFLALGG